MAMTRVIDVLHLLLRPPDEDSDGEVLQRFLTQRDEAAFVAEAVMRSLHVGMLKMGAIVSLLLVALAGGSLMLAGGPGGKLEVPKAANIKLAAKVPVVSWQETKPIPFTNWPISNFAVSPDGKTIAVVVNNRMMHIIDAVTHAEIDPDRIPALKAPATKIGIAYGPKGRLAFTCQNGLVTLERLRDMFSNIPDGYPIFGLGHTLKEGIPDFDPHQVVWIDDLYIVGEGRLLATNGVSFKEIGMTIVKENGIDVLKEVIGEQWESAATEKHQPTLLASAPGMDRVLYSTASKLYPFDIHVRMTDSKPHKIQTLSGHNALSTAGAVSPDGKFYLSGDDAGHLIAWEGEKFQKTQEWKLGGAIVCVAIASDNKTAAVLRRKESKVGDAMSTDWELYLFDATVAPAELTPFWKTSFEGNPRPASLAFHPDGTKLYGSFGERNHTQKPAGLRVWEKIPPQGPLNIKPLPKGSSKTFAIPELQTIDVHSAIYSPDGKTFAVGERGGYVALWDAATHKNCGRPTSTTPWRRRACRSRRTAPTSRSAMVAASSS